MIIDGSSFKGKVSNDMIIGTWWNHEIVQKKAQISAVSGRIIEQKVEFKGKERTILEIQYGCYRIWGATAAILFNLAQNVSQKSI